MLNIQYFKNRILDLVYPEITEQIAPKMIGWFVDSDVIVEKDYIEKYQKNLEKQDCAAFGGADKNHKGFFFNLFGKNNLYSMTSVFYWWN